MKKYSNILFIWVLVIVTACSEKDTPTPISSVTGIWLHDLANTENASDLLAYFVLSEEKASEEFRLILAKESPSTPISSAHLESLAPTAYTTLSATTDLSYRVRFKQDQLDSDGDPLTHNKRYHVHIYAPKSGTFASTSDPFLFNINPIYAGKYSGMWGDNLFDDISISCSIEGVSGDLYIGPAYISSDFTPSFGGEEDNGKFQLNMEEGVIKKFSYSQHAPDYMGGCPGTYRGDGTIDDNFNLIINFTGDDCDGHHENGLMTLYRVWGDK